MGLEMWAGQTEEDMLVVFLQRPGLDPDKHMLTTLALH